ncbi:MAG: hypothetical protein ABSF32_10850 [Ignavibacteria bacterium]|jgi:hypothetical protein
MTRLIPKSYYQRLKKLRIGVKHELNRELEKDTYSIFLHYKSSTPIHDRHYVEKLTCLKHFISHKARSYILELTNTYRKMEYCYEKTILYDSEVKEKFGDHYSKEIFEKERYLFCLLFEIKINLEMSFIYAFSTWNKLLQMLNIYYDLQVPEDNVEDNGEIYERLNSRMNMFANQSIETEFLQKLLNVKGKSKKGIHIFTDSKNIRNGIIHKLSKIGQVKYLEHSKLIPLIDQAEDLLYLNCEAINLFFEIVNKNKYNISHLYKQIGS